MKNKKEDNTPDATESGVYINKQKRWQKMFLWLGFWTGVATFGVCVGSVIVKFALYKFNDRSFLYYEGYVIAIDLAVLAIFLLFGRVRIKTSKVFVGVVIDFFVNIFIITFINRFGINRILARGEYLYIFLMVSQFVMTAIMAFIYISNGGQRDIFGKF
jgi:hypothetical protein